MPHLQRLALLTWVAALLGAGAAELATPPHDEHEDEQVEEAAPATAPEAEALPAPPLTVTPAELKVGTIYDTETKPYAFQLTNTGTAPLTVQMIRAGCSCTAVEDYVGKAIAPGATLEMRFKLTGTKLKPGPFSRTIAVQFTGHSPAILPFSGTMVALVQVTPKRDLSVGEVATADTDWEATAEIQGNFPEGRRMILGTPEHPRFKLALTELAPSHYRLSVKPKKPFTLGRFREEVSLPIVEPAGQEPVVVKLRGQVGGRLMASLPALTFAPAAATDSAPRVATLRLRLAPSRAERQGTLRHMMMGERKVPATPAPRLTKEELTVTAPQGVKTEALADARGIALKLSFDAALLRDEGGKGEIQVAAPNCEPLRIPFRVRTPPPPDETDDDGETP
jgi:hypothetical protein